LTPVSNAFGAGLQTCADPSLFFITVVIFFPNAAAWSHDQRRKTLWRPVPIVICANCIVFILQMAGSVII
jgi:hypothetical protein